MNNRIFMNIETNYSTKLLFFSRVSRQFLTKSCVRVESVTARLQVSTIFFLKFNLFKRSAGSQSSQTPSFYFYYLYNLF